MSWFRIEEEALPRRRRAAIVGVGGLGSLTADRFHDDPDVELACVIEADLHALGRRRAKLKAPLRAPTRGGGDAAFLRRLSPDHRQAIREALDGVELLFIACGLGGGAGSAGAAPLARLARARGTKTIVALATKPFTFEGPRRKSVADASLLDLSVAVDAVVCFELDQTVASVGDDRALPEAFSLAERVLEDSVRAIAAPLGQDASPAHDLDSLRSLLSGSGPAAVGCGTAEGPDRARRAAEAALRSPLWGDRKIGDATGLILQISGSNLTSGEVARAASWVLARAGNDVPVIFASQPGHRTRAGMRVTVIATGVDGRRARGVRPRRVALAPLTHAACPRPAPLALGSGPTERATPAAAYITPTEKAWEALEEPTFLRRPVDLSRLFDCESEE